MLGIDVVGRQSHRPSLASPAVGFTSEGDVIDPRLEDQSLAAVNGNVVTAGAVTTVAYLGGASWSWLRS